MIFTKTACLHIRECDFCMKILKHDPCMFFSSTQGPPLPSQVSNVFVRMKISGFFSKHHQVHHVVTYRIHVTRIFTYIYHRKSTIHVGNYTKPHGSLGLPLPPPASMGDKGIKSLSPSMVPRTPCGFTSTICWC